MSLNGAAPGRLGVRLSPSDLTALSRYLTLQSYLPKDGGLFGSGWAQFMADRAMSPSATNPDVDAGAAASAAAYRTLQSSTGIPDPEMPDIGGRYELAAASPRGLWDYWSPQGCANCHGYTPGTPSPIGGQSPFPPNFSPYARGTGSSGGGGSSQPERPERPQCEMQERRDRGLCAQQPTEKAKAVCNATATDRRVRCDETGDLDEPPLFRARRKNGRPWP
jgi:hypothetical protein